MTGAASDVIMQKYYGDDYNNPKYIEGGINDINRVTVAATLTFTIGLCQVRFLGDSSSQLLNF